MTTRDVMLAFPHPGTVRTEFMARTLQVVQADDSRVDLVTELQTGPGIGIARNTLVKRFLESDCEWLWFADTDMVFSTQTLPLLLKHADSGEHPVVGALCCVVFEGEVEAAMYLATRDNDGAFAFTHLKNWPDDTLLRVDATGTGCLLIHRSVFARLAGFKPDDDGLWFAEIIIDGHQISEDLSFCMRCAMAGIPLYVHTGIQVGHMKAVQLGRLDP